jgi:hypothetical protein
VSDLTVWARDHYDTIKDFAGPGAVVLASFATVLASLAAAAVAYTLGRSQREISQLQATIADKTWKTANDKIVLELFQPRMEIYDAITAVVRKSHTGNSRPDEQLDQLYFEFLQATARAQFYFGEDVAAYLEKLRNLIIDIEEINTIMSDPANFGYQTAVKRRTLQMMEIRKFYSEAPVVFRPYIQAHQRAQH